MTTEERVRATAKRYGLRLTSAKPPCPRGGTHVYPHSVERDRITCLKCGKRP